GFDELEWAPLVGPGLSTIAQPTDELGRLAARCLIERLQGSPSPPRQILLSGQLIIRGSSQKPADVAFGESVPIQAIRS
ncbi:MAG TPA: substrate-binding domain-containing protein, partial [Noviherbaspirillum sp.]